RGVAFSISHGGLGSVTVVLRLERDGTVEVLHAISDQGGGAHTMLQRTVAAELGLPVERVRPRRRTTAEAPPDPGVGGSRVTATVGGAALLAARMLCALLAEVAPGRAFADAAGRAAADGPVIVEATVENRRHHDQSPYGYAVE